MTAGRTADVFHGQFIPDSIGLWTFRVDGWGDPITTWRRAITAKLDAGQGEAELSNDLRVGARLPYLFREIEIRVDETSRPWRRRGRRRRNEPRRGGGRLKSAVASGMSLRSRRARPSFRTDWQPGLL